MEEKEDIITIDFKALFKILWKEKLWILLITSIFTLGGICYAFTAREEFVSEGKLLPEISGGSGNSLGGLANLIGVGGFELGHHGHIGANGSRGSIEQFRRMPTRVIIGHSHQPCRIDDALSVGTSTPLREGYNKGASSWMNAHIVIHENNTAQHLLFVDGEYTTL